MSTQSQMMQWMSLTEEVIFLLDGSLHLSDLLRPPEHNPHSNYFDSQIQQLVSASDGLDAAALSARIEETSATKCGCAASTGLHPSHKSCRGESKSQWETDGPNATIRRQPSQRQWARWWLDTAR